MARKKKNPLHKMIRDAVRMPLRGPSLEELQETYFRDFALALIEVCPKFRGYRLARLFSFWTKGTLHWNVVYLPEYIQVALALENENRMNQAFDALSEMVYAYLLEDTRSPHNQELVKVKNYLAALRCGHETLAMLTGVLTKRFASGKMVADDMVAMMKKDKTYIAPVLQSFENVIWEKYEYPFKVLSYIIMLDNVPKNMRNDLKEYKSKALAMLKGMIKD
ncbi:MAG: hypothetical protein LBL47_03825 [Lactobacillus sp.]|jgi:hypothetical protein|nr:hypothetical protein [Lactobacillus sp.]